MYANKPLIDNEGNLWNGDIFTTRKIYALGYGERGKLPGYSMNLTLAGAARFGPVRGPNFIATAGDVVLIEPRIDHSWEVVSGSPRKPVRGGAAWNVVFCGFVPRPTWTPWLQHPHEMPGYARLKIKDVQILRKIRRAFLEMHDFFRGALPGRTEFQLNLVEHILLWCHAYHASQLKGFDARVQRAVDYLSSHLNEKITLERSAEHSLVSRARLAVLFRRQVGNSPMQFLEMCRLLRAKELLRLTEQTIDTIAATVGFCDAKYFANRFRGRVGVAPSRYRASSRIVSRPYT